MEGDPEPSSRCHCGDRRHVVLRSDVNDRVERISFLKYFASRWNGPLIACIKVHSANLTAATQSLRELDLPVYFSVIFYIVSEGDRYVNDFPVNLLRNIAIRNVVTTHFLVLDMDMWPCSHRWCEV